MNPFRKFFLVALAGSLVACSSESATVPTTIVAPATTQATTTTSSSTSTSSTTSTLPPESVVFETIRTIDVNTSTFQISLQTFPEFAQSFVLERPIEVSQVRIAISHAMIVEPQYFSTPLVSQWKYYVTEPNFGPHTFDVTTAIYRSIGAEIVSDLVDVSDGFDVVARSSATVTMNATIGYNWVGLPNVFIDLGDPVLLDPGRYIVVMSFSWEDRNVFLLRMFGRQAGENTRSGYDQDQPGRCDYFPAEDLYPESRAYTGLGSGKWDRTAAGSIGFGTTFRPAMAKVVECVQPGQFMDIWNQGDVYMALFGRPGLAE